MLQNLKWTKLYLGLFIMLLMSNRVISQSTWQQTSGPATGPVSSFAITKNGNIFTGSIGGGVYISKDGGETWNGANDGLDGFFVTSLSVTPDGQLFAGLFGAPNGIYPGGAYRWNPRTENWTKLSLFNQLVTALQATSGSTIYAASPSAGIDYSMNGGKNWEQIADTLYNIQISCLVQHPLSGNLFVGTSGKGIYQGGTKGGKWEISNNDNGLGSLYINAIIISDKYILAGTSGGMYRSVDYGATWIAVSSWPNIGVNSLSFTPDGSILAGTSVSGVYISTNNTESWAQISTDLPQSSPGRFTSVTEVFSINDTEFLCGFGGEGIYRSQDSGSSWQVKNNGFIVTTINSIAIAGNGDIFAGSASNSVYRSSDLGQTWQSLTEGLTSSSVNRLLIAGNGDIYAGTNSGYVAKSIDNGDTWSSASIGIDNRNIHSLAENDSGHIYAGGFLGDVFKTTDMGSNWTKLTRPASGTVVDLAVDSDNNVYAAILNTGIHRSENGGKTWTDITPSDAGQTLVNYIQSLSVDQNDVLYAGGITGKFLYSTDKGDSWIDRSINETQSLIYSVLAGDNGQIMVGTQLDGIFVSADSGKTWNNDNDGLNLTRVRDIQLHPNGYAVLGSIGSGVYKKMTQITAIQNQDESITDYNLLPNYPNPFNPTTTIVYTLAKRSKVQLSIFNSLGQIVTTLDQGEKPAGSYEFLFDAGHLASGIYHYRLETEGITVSRRMILIK